MNAIIDSILVHCSADPYNSNLRITHFYPLSILYVSCIYHLVYIMKSCIQHVQYIQSIAFI